MSYHPRVALVATSPATVLEDYARLLALAGIDALAGRERLTLCVPRSRYIPALPGERAEPWQLDGTLRALRAAGCGDVRVSLAAHDHMDPLVDVCRRSGTPVIEERDDADLLLCAAAPAGDRSRRLLAGLLPALTILDAATLCRRDVLGRPRLAIRGALLASADPVALDALAAHMLGLGPLPYIPAVAQAHARGLGCGDIRSVELVGDAELAKECWHIAAPAKVRWPAHLLAPLLRRRGWPETTREVYEDWVFNTGWGQLYRAYQRRAIGR
jgi:hypothetical protein